MFYPIVGRLDCGKSLTDHQGFWAEDGFGLLAMYKSDWNRVGGKSNLNGKINRKRNNWSFLIQLSKAILMPLPYAMYLSLCNRSTFFHSLCSPGMDVEKFKYKWGGEDWDFLDRVVRAKLEVERYKYPGLYHHFHHKRGMWDMEPTTSNPLG